MKSKILYIDDDPEACQSFVNDFQEFDVTVVNSISELYKALETVSNIPDLFIVDWYLPDEMHTAEGLIVELSKKYPKIGIMILSAGKDYQEMAKTIAKLPIGDFIFKPVFKDSTKYDEIKNGINELLSKKQKIEEQGWLKANQEEIFEKLTKKANDQIRHITNAAKDFEYKKGILDQENKKLTRQKEILEKKSEEQNIKEIELKKNKQLLMSLLSISENIVHEGLGLNEFLADLLNSINSFVPSRAAAILFASNNEGGLFFLKDRNTEVNPQIYKFIKIHVRDLGRGSRIDSLIESDNNVIRTNLQDEHIFEKASIPEIKNASNVLFIPLKIDDKVIGKLFLFDKIDRLPFNETDYERIQELPLGSILQCASEMPFRTYDNYGLLSILLRRPWKLKQYVISTSVEILKVAIYLIAVSFVLFPLYRISSFSILYILGNHNDGLIIQLRKDVLWDIELLVMSFTFVVFSLGMMILLEPKYAKGLPQKWMLNFSNISTLEKSLFTLVSIILSIHLLSTFLSGVPSALNLLITSIAAAIVMIISGIFIKYFLNEKD